MPGEDTHTITELIIAEQDRRHLLGWDYCSGQSYFKTAVKILYHIGLVISLLYWGITALARTSNSVEISQPESLTSLFSPFIFLSLGSSLLIFVDSLFLYFRQTGCLFELLHSAADILFWAGGSLWATEQGGDTLEVVMIILAGLKLLVDLVCTGMKFSRQTLSTSSELGFTSIFVSTQLLILSIYCKSPKPPSLTLFLPSLCYLFPLALIFCPLLGFIVFKTGTLSHKAMNIGGVLALVGGLVTVWGVREGIDVLAYAGKGDGWILIIGGGILGVGFLAYEGLQVCQRGLYRNLVRILYLENDYRESKYNTTWHSYLTNVMGISKTMFDEKKRKYIGTQAS